MKILDLKKHNARKSHGTSILMIVTISLTVICVFGFWARNTEQNSVVNQVQHNMVAKVKQARLIGSGKQKVIAFFRQQQIACMEQYGLLQGAGWDEFANKTVSASTLGMIISGESGVFTHTTGFLGCTKNWSLDVGVLFDKKGKVIGVEVMPTYFGCDV